MFFFDFFGLTDEGQRRKGKPNEDTILAQRGSQRPDGSAYGLFVVADGMGGHGYGQEASQKAVEALVRVLIPVVELGEKDPQVLENLLKDGVEQANMAVYLYNCETGKNSGTTMVVALIVGSIALIASVGDSRAYLFRPSEGGLRRITTDHSTVQRLVEHHLISPEDVYTHPRRNEIYRSLGHDPTVTVDGYRVSLQEGDALLLCSDGLWEMVRDPQISAILAAARDPWVSAGQLVNAANANGGADNISAVVVTVEGETVPWVASQSGAAFSFDEETTATVPLLAYANTWEPRNPIVPFLGRLKNVLSLRWLRKMNRWIDMVNWRVQSIAAAEPLDSTTPVLPFVVIPMLMGGAEIVTFTPYDTQRPAA